ncbi:MAG: exopolyphosphatase [Candidatus Latescibacterota bacterium]|nr:MAG: exopolyphosphatase [Candidatus Latescibacterota bacterium]
MKFAAIDIGTNAVRLLLTNVIEGGGSPLFKKEALVRMPIRLGADAFGSGRISDEKVDRLVESMIGFKHLIKAYPALDYMAMATSAMRVAENGPEVASIVDERAGILIDIIDGRTEAEVIYANHIEDRLDPDNNYFYVDVGGGSTEISIIVDREVIASASFRIGTVRTLRGSTKVSEWQKMKDWLTSKTSQHRPITGIGSGGNINKIFKLAHIIPGSPITYKRIRKMHKFLSSFSLDERILNLKLRPDRADVIIPASEIYLSVMKWAGAKSMFVPQFGLSDGMVHVLYDRYRTNTPV